MHFRKLLYILAISFGLGGYSAWFNSNRPARSGDDEIHLIKTAEAESLWHKSTTVFVDVRTESDYAYGHIAGAVLLPLEELDERLPDLKPRLQRAQVIVVYCKSIDCGKSLWAALQLRQAGLIQTKIFPAGFHEWSRKGLPSHKTATR